MYMHVYICVLLYMSTCTHLQIHHPYLCRSLSTKEPSNLRLFCGKRPATCGKRPATQGILCIFATLCLQIDSLSPWPAAWPVWHDSHSTWHMYNVTHMWHDSTYVTWRIHMWHGSYRTWLMCDIPDHKRSTVHWNMGWLRLVGSIKW